jgi:hypothetical protein
MSECADDEHRYTVPFSLFGTAEPICTGCGYTREIIAQAKARSDLDSLLEKAKALHEVADAHEWRKAWFRSGVEKCWCGAIRGRAA